MATPTHAARIDEVIVTREHATRRARVFLPSITPEKELSLGRIFGFAELNVPRTPQIDDLLAGIETELERIYRTGSLRPGENPELFFEQSLRRVEDWINTFAHERRIRIDPATVNLFFGCVAGTQVLMSGHGEVCAFLIRRTPGKPVRVVDIFRGLHDESSDEPAKRLLGALVSGSITGNDLFLFATESLVTAVPVADFVKNTEQIDQAGIAAHLRTLAVAAHPPGPAIGLILRLAPVRHLMAHAQNASVKNLLSHEEEVARVLRPAGMPEIGTLLNRFKKPFDSAQGKPEPVRRLPRGPRQGLIGRFNDLPRRIKIASLLALSIAALFLVSLEVARFENKAKARNAAAEERMDGVRTRIDDAEASIIFDEARARVLAEEAQALFNALPAPTKNEKTAYDELAASLAALDRRLAHLYDVTPRTVATLDGPGTVLAMRDDLRIASSGANLVRIAGTSAPETIATLSDVPVWVADDGVTLYLWLKNGTLVSMDPTKGLPKALDYAGPSNPRDGGMWNGSLYVITSDGKQVWKLPPTTTGFGTGAPWLTDELPGNGATAMAIDGTIFAAIQDDGIRDYVRGKALPFGASGSSAAKDTHHLVLTTDVIYALGTDGTISAWNRDGKLLAQYLIPAENGTVRAFTVDEKEKTVTAVTDKGIVLQFDLQK